MLLSPYRLAVLLMKLQPEAEGTGGSGNPPDSEPPSGKETPPPGAETTPPADDILSETSDPKALHAALKKARKDAADTRTKYNQTRTTLEDLSARVKKLGGGGEEVPPEQQIEALSAHAEELSIRHALLGQAYEHDVPKDCLEYFEHLVSKEVSALNEGEEVTEERIAELAVKAKAISTIRPSGTTVPTGGGRPPAPPSGGAGTMSPEAFAELGLSAKSALFGKNPDLYHSLMEQCRIKKISLGR